jgi:hypothetical protein
MRKSGFVRLLEAGAIVCVLAVVGPGLPSRALADPEPSDDASDLEYRWPLAYLQRPMTLLRGMMAFGGTAGTVAPNHTDNIDPTNGVAYQFFPYATAGLFMDAGITDRLELDLFAPRLACADGGQAPSGCSTYNRFDGTGASLAYGFIRRAQVQGALTAVLEMERSSPAEIEWRAVAAFKLVPWDVLGIGLSASLQRDINPPATQTINPTIGSINVGFDWQVTERTLLWLNFDPWTSLGNVGEGIALEIYGGTSYTVDHHAQLALEAGSYNVLANPDWSRSVPEWFTELTFVYWRY